MAVSKSDRVADALYLVVMAGGIGSRFWPKSSKKNPKQFLNFNLSSSAEKPASSLLQTTLRRFARKIPQKNTLVVTTELLSESILSHCGSEVKILAEPQGRNTAPAIYWAAQNIAQQDPHAVMVVVPADHYMGKPEAFLRTLDQAIAVAQTEPCLITLGVKPAYAETGYGYLKTEKRKDQSGAALRVRNFVEKPSRERAEEYLRDPSYLWNAGIFVWQTTAILSAFDRYMPEMKKAWLKHGGNVQQAYPQMTATSIDYGIMEKAASDSSGGVLTFPLDCDWSDLGNWNALEKLIAADDSGNTVVSGNVLSLQSTGNIIDVDVNDGLLALVACRDLIIVKQGKNFLICHKDESQKIKDLVQRLEKEQPERV